MTDTPIPAAIDPAAEYDVKLAKIVEVAGATFLPLDDHFMTGAFLTRIIQECGQDAVYTASPVAR